MKQDVLDLPVQHLRPWIALQVLVREWLLELLLRFRIEELAELDAKLLPSVFQLGDVWYLFSGRKAAGC